MGSGAGKPKKDWRYSKEMSFLTPYLAISHPKAFQNDDFKQEDECYTEESELMETYFVDVNAFRESSEGGHFMGALLDFSEANLSSTSELSGLAVDNDVDSFFKGLAEVVKRLNPINQVKIQKDIVNMVFDMKLKEVQEYNNNQ